MSAEAHRGFDCFGGTWTGIGIIAGYGLAVLGLTYYLRDRIGTARWRRVLGRTADSDSAREGDGDPGLRPDRRSTPSPAR